MTNTFALLLITPGLKTPADSKALPRGRMMGSGERRCQSPQGGVRLVAGKATSVRKKIKVIVLTTEFDINMNNSRAGNLQVGKGGLPPHERQRRD
jgi:hypothetical protein